MERIVTDGTSGMTRRELVAAAAAMTALLIVSGNMLGCSLATALRGKPGMATVGSGEDGASPAAHRTIKVFLLGGQSNMNGSGRAGDLPPELQRPQEDVLFFHTRSSSVTSLRPGTGSGFGPEITFGRTIADALPDESFALIKHAEAATDLENQWDPAEGSSYAAFRSVVAGGLEALAKEGHPIEIVGMLWTQGERDARMGFGATYEANLKAFITDIRSRYGAGMPFFISQLSSAQTNLPAAGLDLVRKAQAKVAAADPTSHLVVTDTFGMRPDDLHFSSPGNMALGRGFADAYLRLR